MLNPLIAFQQAQLVTPELAGKKLGDMRYLVFNQNFSLGASPAGLASLTQQGPTGQPFAAGAIILGVTASATPVTQPAQPFLTGRQRFQLAINYTQSDALTTSGTGQTGLGNADAVLGGGDDTIFPPKFLYFPPQQSAFTTVANLTTEALRITISYHALVWRFSQ
jgi:hypothetical protein